jgi:hypothetical protein
MGFIYLVKQSFARLGHLLRAPHNYLSIVRRTGEQFFLGGMPSDHVDLVVMSFKRLNLCVHFTYIEQFNLVILGACQEPHAVNWVPADLVDSIIMCLVQGDYLATPRVPDSNMLVLTARKNKRLRGVPIA